MVNAKNAFVGTMLAGIIIAAVGSEKYYSGNWDSMSGDFVYANKDARFNTMTGRYYAENTQACSISQTGSDAKGTECDLHSGLDYQIEMTNGELEFFASNDVITTTNLETGESTTSKATMEEANPETTAEAAWTVVDGKLTQADGTTMEVSNTQSPGRKIRDLWGGFRCGFGGKCWAEYLWQKYTTCGGLFWALLDNILWCIGWIIYLFATGVLTTATWGAATPAFIIGLAGFTTHCVRGVVFVIVLLMLRCGYDVLKALFDAATNGNSTTCRQLGGGGFGSGSGGGYGSGNKGCGGNGGNNCSRVVRALGGGCRMLNRDLGGGCRVLGGGGGGSNCGNNYKKKNCSNC